MDSKTRSIIFEQFLQDLASSVRDLGLVRKRHRLVIARTNLGIAEIQRSMSSTTSQIRLTVNIGGISRRVDEFFGILRRKSEVPRSDVWHWRVRLGNLAADPKDLWWTITNEANSVDTTMDIAARLRRHAMRDLNCVLDDTCLRDAWLNGYAPGLTHMGRLRNLAALLDAIGPRERLAAVIEEIRRSRPYEATAIEKRLRPLDTQD